MKKMKKIVLALSAIAFAAFLYNCEKDQVIEEEQALQDVEKTASNLTLKSSPSYKYHGMIFKIRSLNSALNSQHPDYIGVNNNHRVVMQDIDGTLEQYWLFRSNWDDSYNLRNMGKYLAGDSKWNLCAPQTGGEIISLESGYNANRDHWFVHNLGIIPSIDPNTEAFWLEVSGGHQTQYGSKLGRKGCCNTGLSVNFSDSNNEYWALERVPNHVVVYKHGPRTNPSASFGIGDYNIDTFNSTIGNDQLSSLAIICDWNEIQVTIYEHKDFRGRAYNFTGRGIYDVSAYFNGKTSSMQIAPIYEETDFVTIYAHGPGTSPNASFGIGHYNVDTFNSTIGNDQLTTIKVSGDLKVTIYKDADFKGNSYTLTAGTYDYFNDVTSSMIVERR